MQTLHSHATHALRSIRVCTAAAGKGMSGQAPVGGAAGASYPWNESQLSGSVTDDSSVAMPALPRLTAHYPRPASAVCAILTRTAAWRHLHQVDGSLPPLPFPRDLGASISLFLFHPGCRGESVRSLRATFHWSAKQLHVGYLNPATDAVSAQPRLLVVPVREACALSEAEGGSAEVRAVTESVVLAVLPDSSILLLLGQHVLLQMNAHYRFVRAIRLDVPLEYREVPEPPRGVMVDKDAVRIRALAVCHVDCGKSGSEEAAGERESIVTLHQRSTVHYWTAEGVYRRSLVLQRDMWPRDDSTIAVNPRNASLAVAWTIAHVFEHGHALFLFDSDGAERGVMPLARAVKLEFAPSPYDESADWLYALTSQLEVVVYEGTLSSRFHNILFKLGGTRIRPVSLSCIGHSWDPALVGDSGERLQPPSHPDSTTSLPLVPIGGMAIDRSRQLLYVRDGSVAVWLVCDRIGRVMHQWPPEQLQATVTASSSRSVRSAALDGSSESAAVGGERDTTRAVWTQDAVFVPMNDRLVLAGLHCHGSGSESEDVDLSVTVLE